MYTHVACTAELQTEMERGQISQIERTTDISDNEGAFTIHFHR